MKNLYYYNSPVGKIGIAEEQGLITNVLFINMKPPLSVKVRETEAIAETYKQICEFLDGQRLKFNIPINPSGDKLHQQVLIDILRVPFAETISYKDLGLRHNLHPRAVGAIVAKNPIPLIIPCHRIIGSNGNLTGYIGGLELKKKLLNLESQVWRRYIEQ